MYLFSRRARLTSAAALEWATTILARVKEVTGHDAQLWAHTFSPGFGTVSWTSWWEDLSSLEKAMTSLQGDAKFGALAAEGGALIAGQIDDSLTQIIYGDLDAAASNQYAQVVQAVCANGGAERAIAVGIEIAQRVGAIAGTRTLFGQAVTGPYGAVGWLTGYENIEALETAQAKLAADSGWLSFIDTKTKGCFVEDPSITQATLHRRLA